MLIHPEFDPIAVRMGPVAIHWYGLMYLIGFGLFYLLGMFRCRQDWRGISRTNLDDLLFYGMIGVILGGRLGFVCFYQPEYYFSHPLAIFEVWNGGMSAHGGFIGVILALLYFSWRNHKSVLTSVTLSRRWFRSDFSSAVWATLLMVSSGEERRQRICPGQ